jgi:hypothetical protein
LQATRGSVEALVIDHVARPSENRGGWSGLTGSSLCHSTRLSISPASRSCAFPWHHW